VLTNAFRKEIQRNMAKSKELKEIDTSTEEKIIEASRRMFVQKGYAGTRTRDVAEEAGINPALLNYYFRSKEKLFQLVIVEEIQQFVSVVLPIVDDNALSLDEKLKALVRNYIDMLIENPDRPIFILSEVRTDPDRFFRVEMQVRKVLRESSLVRQIREKRPDVEPVQFVFSLLGMTIFPFVAKSVLFLPEDRFHRLMEERKALIAKWAKAMLES